MNQHHVDHFLSPILNDIDIQQAIISTDPQNRKPYYFWCIDRNIDVFSDKPLTSSPKNLYKDYLAIEHAVVNHQTQFTLSCERREHLGYHYVNNFIKNFISTYHMPITYIDIHFASGNWLMPAEYWERENHPFKYGYGLLFHSGYHYIDLLITLLQHNSLIVDDFFQHKKTNVLYTTPRDILNLYPPRILSQIFPDHPHHMSFSSQSYDHTNPLGESDILMSGQFFKKNTVLSQFNINLFSHSLSNRKNPNQPKNPYLDTGRLRQEKISIHFGALCSIHITSFPYAKISTSTPHEHFDITILTHPNLQSHFKNQSINRKDLSTIYPELPLSISMNKQARLAQLEKFLNHQITHSELDSHKTSIRFFQDIIDLM